MLPAICGIVIVVSIIIQICISRFHFAIRELNDTDFSEDEKFKEIYDHYTDRFLNDYQVFWISVSIGSMIAGIAASVFSRWLFLTLEEQYLLSFSMILRAVCTILILLFMEVCYLSLGILTPYHLAGRHTMQDFIRMKGWYRFFEVLYGPIRGLAYLISVGVSVLFGTDPRKVIDDVTEEDVIDLVNEGHEQGVFKASEAAMIQNIFEFDEKVARDVMINRKNVVAINGESTFAEAINFFNDNHYSRIPVYLEDLDQIIGIIHMKEVLKYAADTEAYQRQIKDFPELMYDAEFVPETHGIHTLFTQMQLSKSHLIIVVDEYGQTAGVVTMEDILEEIVGNIQDEHDEEEESVKKIRQDHFQMTGATPMEEVEDTLGIDVGDIEFETLNGFLTDQYKNVPEDGAHFSIEAYGYLFEVLDVKNRIIADVNVTKLPQEPDTVSEYEV